MHISVVEGNVDGVNVGTAVGDTVRDTVGDTVGAPLSTQKVTLVLFPKAPPDKISVPPSVTLNDPVPAAQQIPSPIESVISNV